MVIWSIFTIVLLFMEGVYHLGAYGWSYFNPLPMLIMVSILASISSFVVGNVKSKWKNFFFWLIYVVEFLFFASQYIYYRIFRQPLQIKAAILGGEDAVAGYWREALDGMIASLPILILLLVPALVIGILLFKKIPLFKEFQSIHNIRVGFVLGISIILGIFSIYIGQYIDSDDYEAYMEFYDPLSVVENMGVVTMIQRDVTYEVQTLFTNNEHKREQRERTEDWLAMMTEKSDNILAEAEKLEDESDLSGIEDTLEDSSKESLEQATQELPISISYLQEAANNSEMEWLAEYIANLETTETNEYTGYFEDYNLIYLTAEGFSSYAINEELTPTLYKLANSGFVFPNYYVPLWQTSTSDGEYINCTGLIPDGQFSMRKSGQNQMLYTLPQFFAQDGVVSRAYHNNSLSYYDRYITHFNLGYDFKGARLGDLSAEEWGNQIFPMENPNDWPASDLEMLQGTVPDYIGEDRFHVYYMTISGHMNYNFSGNSMSAKNQEAVSNLEMSENAKAYIACNIELDKALEYLLAQLEAAGKLENTVICLSADHYPYAMTDEQYEELAGKELSDNMDAYRNTLILWNAQMKEPVVVDKACGSMDLVPTLLNLFGYEYDSRLYAGKDIFSSAEGMVIFNDRSFVTDSVVYSKKDKRISWLVEMGEAEMELYLDEKKEEVKNRYQFSAYVLRNDYYKTVKEALQ